METPPYLLCPTHLSPLYESQESNLRVLRCGDGCEFPIIDSIPRFVSAANYAASFGIQWEQHVKTQLDSYTGQPTSRDRLARCFGRPLEELRGKRVLEAGCGAGRFTEVLLNVGAEVFATDLSSAVTANYKTFHDRPNYFVCQADLLAMPLPRAIFDVVFCLGVIQHTPSPETTISTLAEFVRPGGLLVIDHYIRPTGVSWKSRVYSKISPQALARAAILRLPPSARMPTTQLITKTLLPLHRIFWNERGRTSRIYKYLRMISPVADRFLGEPKLNANLLEEWAYLDTHDLLTDYYKHTRTPGEIENALKKSGLIDIHCSVGGNGVEARASKPSAS